MAIQLMKGDVIFEDSNRSGAKIAKFFMTAPTVFHHIYRMIKKTQQKCNYYHPVLIISDTEMIEQQWKVQITSNENINKEKYIVFRPRYTPIIVEYAKQDLGKKWGVVHVFGRLFTWLTGIPYFARYFKLPNEEVSAGRVAKWMYEAYNEKFGHKTYQEATTNTMVRWMLNNPQIYKVVEKVG